MSRERSKSFFGQTHRIFEDVPKKEVEIKAHEKRAIISNFLHDDEVFNHLCRIMFKPEEPYIGQTELHEVQTQLTQRNQQIIGDQLDPKQDAINKWFGMQQEE